MPELTVKDVEVVRDIPGNPQEKGGPAKILKVHFENDERQPELFATARTPIPSTGEKMDDSRLTFNEQWNRWEFKREQKAGGGGFKRSPAETAAIQRQHSQNMALERERNIIAAGGQPYSGEQLRSVINWFDEDIKGKDRAIKWDGLTSDVPVDVTDLDPRVA